MTNPIPAVDFTAPRLAPSGYGLLSAATVFDVTGPARHLGGVRGRPVNCDTGGGTYPVDMCDDEPPGKAPGDRGRPLTFAAMTVYAASEAGPGQPVDEVTE